MPEIEYSDYFRKATHLLPKEIQKKLAKALRLLAQDPRHPGLRTKPIRGLSSGSPKIYEARIDQSYRFTYERKEGDVLLLRNVGEHDITSKNP
jgi:mRNA interferase RelE/StbE